MPTRRLCEKQEHINEISTSSHWGNTTNTWTAKDQIQNTKEVKKLTSIKKKLPCCQHEHQMKDRVEEAAAEAEERRILPTTPNDRFKCIHIHLKTNTTDIYGRQKTKPVEIKTIKNTVRFKLMWKKQKKKKPEKARRFG